MDNIECRAILQESYPELLAELDAVSDRIRKFEIRPETFSQLNGVSSELYKQVMSVGIFKGVDNESGLVGGDGRSGAGEESRKTDEQRDHAEVLSSSAEDSEGDRDTIPDELSPAFLRSSGATDSDGTTSESSRGQHPTEVQAGADNKGTDESASPFATEWDFFTGLSV